jgi:hypothetical protein
MGSAMNQVLKPTTSHGKLKIKFKKDPCTLKVHAILSVLKVIGFE